MNELMKVRNAAKKLDSTVNFLISVEVVLMLWNIGYALFLMRDNYIVKEFIGGMCIRLILQGVVLIGLATKEKNLPKTGTAWLVFISALFSGFTNIYSGPTYVFYGNIELVLLITSVVLLFRHYSYTRAVKEDEQANKTEKG